MRGLSDMMCELGDATRLRVLFAILEARKNVSQIVAELGLTQPQVSYHLRKLKDAGLAVEEKDGRWVWYQVAWGSQDALVQDLLELLTRWSGDTQDARPVVTRDRPSAPPRMTEREELEDFLL